MRRWVVSSAIMAIALMAGLSLVSMASKAAAPTYQFVEVYAVAYPKADEDARQERRWYFSQVIVMPTDVPSYSLVKKVFSPYFARHVMDPVEARGIVLDFSEQDVRMNGETSYTNYETKAEAEAELKKAIEYRKGQGGNIYSFEIDLKDPKGEATSKPKLVYHDKEQVIYDKPKQ